MKFKIKANNLKQQLIDLGWGVKELGLVNSIHSRIVVYDPRPETQLAISGKFVKFDLEDGQVSLLGPFHPLYFDHSDNRIAPEDPTNVYYKRIRKILSGGSTVSNFLEHSAELLALVTKINDHLLSEIF